MYAFLQAAGSKRMNLRIKNTFVAGGANRGTANPLKSALSDKGGGSGCPH